MRHIRSNDVVSFNIYETNPKDKREPKFQLVIMYHSFWLFERFFETEKDANNFVENKYKFFYDLCEEEERELLAHQQIWAKETKELLKCIWR